MVKRQTSEARPATHPSAQTQKNKKRKNKKKAAKTVQLPLDGPEHKKAAKRKKSQQARPPPSLNGNELLSALNKLLRKVPNLKRVFDPSLADDERDELLEIFETEGMDLVDKYGWAVPDERALKIVSHFSPLIEVGAGRGYWSRLLRDGGADVVAYDVDVPTEGDERRNWTTVLVGGPKVVTHHANRTLFLCYPDDFETSAASVAVECLRKYSGDTIIHVGELFGSAFTHPSPWGRSTGEEFQCELAASFHMVLQVGLPSWPTANDTLTVWKRTPVCQVADDLAMAFIAPNERLAPVSAAPSLAKLIHDITPSSAAGQVRQKRRRKPKFMPTQSN